MEKISLAEFEMRMWINLKPVFANQLDIEIPHLRRTPEMREANQKKMDITYEILLEKQQKKLKDLLEEKTQFELANPLGPKYALKFC